MSTYTPVASITLASTVSSVTFSGIPQTYTDLVIVAQPVGDNNGENVGMQFNGDTGNNYSYTDLRGNGTTASSTRASNFARINFTDLIGTTSTAGNLTIIANVMNYANTNVNKSVLIRSNQTTNTFPGTEAIVGLWRNTNAVTSIRFVQSGSANFISGTTFNIYGIANASLNNTAKATGGDSVVRDGSYWYHVFLSSGTFTPTQTISADCLVIAGGGGTGIDFSGGGGAGGLVYTAAQSFASSTAYTVTVGGGGPLKSVSNGLSSDMSGSNSNITGGALSLTAAIGGGGGGLRGGTGQNGTAAIGAGGGSAGGTAYDGSGTAFATGTAGQGNNGGRSLGTDVAYGVGGGGGAGAAGADGTNSSGGVGGIGVNTYSSWATATNTGASGYYAGGGAGAGQGTTPAGGLGGGGAAADSGSANNGTANTGGGAGGVTRNTGSGGNGGSGIVIVRYAV